MKWNLKFEGGAELARNLNALPDAVSRKVIAGALREAAEPIRNRAELKAPRSPVAPHLAENIVIGTAPKDKNREGEHVVEVGPSGGSRGNDYFYGYFQEFGTVRHGAQPFMRPAFDAGAVESLGILGRALWKALRGAVPSSGRATPGGGLA